MCDQVPTPGRRLVNGQIQTLANRLHISPKKILQRLIPQSATRRWSNVGTWLACQRSPHVGPTWATQPLGWYGWPNVGTTLVKIHLLFRIIPLIQWSVMFCRPCFNRFWGLKYISRLFSEYMLTFRVEESMKICVTN
jgi:hypothetical protein